MACVQRISRRSLIGLAVAAGLLVGGILLLALWPRGVCDLSPCTLYPGSLCIHVQIIGPCPVRASTITIPLVVAVAVAVMVMIAGIWKQRGKPTPRVSSVKRAGLPRQ